MKRSALLVSLCLLLGQPAWAEGSKHRLLPTPRTVTWGYFDARTPPVLRIRSGDTVEIEALPGGGVEALEAAGLPRDKMQAALLEVDREVKDRGEVPHILTGPIWVQGAEPGDVLEVKILSVELVVPYAWNSFLPGRGFLPDEDGEWIREVRHELEALQLRALECYAQACLGVGGTELAAAERAGRELTKLAPYRESGHRLLMRALAARGNTAEALRVYEQLRTLLREELGIAPCAETLALHAELLTDRVRTG